MAFLNVKSFFFHHSFYAPFGYNIFYGLENFIPPHSSRALIKEQPQRAARDIVVGVSRPWDAQPHIFMARGLAAFSRMFVQFFISALLAPSMQGRRLSVSPASSLSSFVPVCQRAIFPSLPRAAYLPSALCSGNLPCALLGIEPNALAGWRVTHRAKHNLNHEIKKHIILVILPYPFPQAYRCLTSCRILRRALCRSVSAHWLASP